MSKDIFWFIDDDTPYSLRRMALNDAYGVDNSFTEDPNREYKNPNSYKFGEFYSFQGIGRYVSK